MDFKFKYRRDKPDEHEQRGEERKERETTRRLRSAAYGLSIPFGLLSGPLFGWLIGRWLDETFHTGFWMITLIVLGTAAGFAMTIDMLRKLSD